MTKFYKPGHIFEIINHSQMKSLLFSSNICFGHCKVEHPSVAQCKLEHPCVVKLISVKNKTELNHENIHFFLIF